MHNFTPVTHNYNEWYCKIQLVILIIVHMRHERQVPSSYTDAIKPCLLGKVNERVASPQLPARVESREPPISHAPTPPPPRGCHFPDRSKATCPPHCVACSRSPSAWCAVSLQPPAHTGCTWGGGAQHWSRNCVIVRRAPGEREAGEYSFEI